MTTITNQFLQGNYAPWPQENEFNNIFSIIGKIPLELNGVLYRNGPNPQFSSPGKHWFEGDGMLHAFFIQNGQISYRNRWIQTERFKLERRLGKALFSSFNDAESFVENIPHNTANTNIIQYAGKLFALQETSCPIEIHPMSLETLGNWSYHQQVPQMSAHPHFDFQTGEMHSYAYSPGTNDVIYYIFNRDGMVSKTEIIHAPYSSFMHDFFITKDYVIFPVLPLTCSIERMQQGKSMIMWEPEKGSHIGIMPRKGHEKNMIWFDLESFHAFHFMNAYQQGDTIILDGMKSERAHLFPDAKGKIASLCESPPQLTRWTFDLKQKRAVTTKLDSLPIEFPRIDERFTGLPYRHGFAAACVQSNDLAFDAIVHYDLTTQSQTIREFGLGNTPSEPIFVPRHLNSAEGDGFILTVVYNKQKDVSDLYILDAMNINKEPLAIVQLPHRIPNGFHGNWYNNSGCL